jgi:DNA-binding beta-propeller fold protein YncE
MQDPEPTTSLGWTRIDGKKPSDRCELCGDQAYCPSTLCCACLKIRDYTEPDLSASKPVRDPLLFDDKKSPGRCDICALPTHDRLCRVCHPVLSDEIKTTQRTESQTLPSRSLVSDSSQKHRCDVCEPIFDADIAHVKCHTCNKKLCAAHFNAHDDNHDVQELSPPPRCQRCENRALFVCHTCDKQQFCAEHLQEHGTSHNLQALQLPEFVVAPPGRCEICAIAVDIKQSYLGSKLLCSACSKIREANKRCKLCFALFRPVCDSPNSNRLCSVCRTVFSDEIKTTQRSGELTATDYKFCCTNLNTHASDKTVMDKVAELRICNESPPAQDLRCTIHKKRLHMFCSDCLLRICTVCAASDTGHRKHRVISAKEAKAEILPRLEALTQEVPALEEKLRSRQFLLENINQSVKDEMEWATITRDGLKASIDKACDEIVEKARAYLSGLPNIGALRDVQAAMNTGMLRFAQSDEAAVFDSIALLALASKRAGELLASVQVPSHPTWRPLTDGFAAACQQWADSYHPAVASSEGSPSGVASKPVKFTKTVIEGIEGGACMFHTDSKNNLIVPLRNSGCVKIFDNAGKWLRTVGEKILKGPVDALVDSRGYMFVADEVMGGVAVFMPDGTYDRAAFQPIYKHPCAIALSRDELVLYVADNNASTVFACRSRVNSSWSWKCPVSEVQSLAVLSSGSIVAVSSSKDGVCIISPDGKVTQSFGQTVLSNPRGVAVDTNDDVIVVNHGAHLMCIFSSDGTLLVTFGGSSPGYFSYPWGVAIGSDNAIYVSDFGGRIQEFRC